MNAPLPKKSNPLSKEIAVCAVMTALLIGGQAAFAAVVGLEIVTVLLLTFSWSFGKRAGVWTAVTFSVLRCLLWGFHLPTIIQYLIYYPLFALLFGQLGKVMRRTGKETQSFSLPSILFADVLLALLAAGCFFCAATDILKLSVLAATGIKTLLWILFGCFCALFVLVNAAPALSLKKRNARTLAASGIVTVTAVAAVCTICFTLLDDILTPLCYGWGLESSAALSYFYGSFLALVPQTLCTVITVSVFFLPLTSLFEKIAANALRL